MRKRKSATSTPDGTGVFPSPTTEAEIDAFLASLKPMSLAELRVVWHHRHGTEPPVKKSADMLRRFLAWNAQEQVYGGLSAATKRRLWSLEQAIARNPDHQPAVSQHMKLGTVLVREWKGANHRVEVVDGGFSYGDKRFDSLSQIARIITGTRWSGPAFFGLRAKGSKA